ncbi:hypothetical protein E6H21_07100 [Candidatus Bathyarchaeota archaeon]|nr:MAG: hypothetical protein E6H21_07100 [Candidatus Bathyarchaeota archaeon]
MSGENIIAAIVGGLVGGSTGYKAGFSTGYKRREEEDRWMIGTLRSQVAQANQTIQNQLNEMERLKAENQALRSQTSIADRIKGALTT